MKRKLFYTPFVSVAALLALGFTAPGAYAQTLQATLSASPANYSGQCPGKITFSGQITAQQPGKVQYKFIRSDGAFAPIKTLNFDHPGSKAVSTTWTLGGDQLPQYDGWQAIEIVYPTSLTSNHAAFHLRCAQREAPAPVITGYRFDGRCVKKGERFTIIGRNFGAHSGKGVALGGHGIHVDLPVHSWNPNRILATLPDDTRIQGNEWYYTGVERADHGAWLSNISERLTVCADPERGGLSGRLGPRVFTDLNARGKPDLVVKSFGLKRWGRCAPNNAVFTFQVTVANVGSAASPAVSDHALVQVMDQHRNWGNGAKLGAIAPGAAQTVEIPVYYLQADPGHMTDGAPHPFQAKVDPGNRVAESNELNNQSAIVKVGAPKECQ